MVLWQIRSGRYPFFLLDEGYAAEDATDDDVMAMAKVMVPSEPHPVLVNVEKDKRRIEAKYDETAGGSWR